MRKIVSAALLTAGLTGVTGAVLIAPAGGDTPGQGVRAYLQAPDGSTVGRVDLRQRGPNGTVTVGYRLSGLTPGFHGFHVHETGVCQAPAFTSAGGHLKVDGQVHGGHVGDMPVVLVNEDGTARGTFQTDRFALADLKDGDGSAVIVHAKPDNYANIPTDRYDPDPDAMTLNTGDAGSRAACGVIR